MARAVILGYYGFRNTGDEALLEAIAGSLRRRAPDLEIAVLTAARPSEVQVPGLIPVNRWNPLAVARVLRRSQLLIAGGGTLLQDSTSLRSLVYYVSVVMLARALGNRVMFYANGLGPLRSAAGCWLARSALRAADAVSLRDRKSLELLRALAPDLAERVRLTADPALLLEPEGEEAARAALADAGLAPGRPFIAACVRPWPGVAYEAPLAAALDRVAGEWGTATVFLPMQMARDADASRRVMALMRSEAHMVTQPLRPRVFMAALAAARAVAAMRLHAAVLAAAVGRPAVGIAYDPKVNGVLADLGLPIIGEQQPLTADGIAGELGRLFAAESQVCAELRERVARARGLAEEDARLALALLPAAAPAG